MLLVVSINLSFKDIWSQAVFCCSFSIKLPFLCVCDGEWKKSPKSLPLDEELKATDDCWEIENQSYPGISTLFDYPISMASANKLFIGKHYMDSEYVSNTFTCIHTCSNNN